MPDQEPNEKKPLLALCLIVRDSPRVLDLLDSVLRQLEESGPNAVRGETAFDELVIVDTGSKDDTRQRIQDRLRRYVMGPVLCPEESNWEIQGYLAAFPELGQPPAEIQVTDEDGDLVFRAVMASYRCPWEEEGWGHIGHFAAARQRAFELATARWRGYLDADDVFPGARRLKPTLRHTERASPLTNCIALPYAYQPGRAHQEVSRFVRWEEGWEWRGRIHEGLYTDRPRMISRYLDLTVEHHSPAEADPGRMVRNERIIRAAYAEAEGLERLRLAYYMGRLERCYQRPEEARRYFLEAAAQRGNFGGYSRVQLADVALDLGDFREAVAQAGAAIADAPEMQATWATAAMVHALAGDPHRAIDLWETYRRRGAPVFEPLEDQEITRGLAPVRVAECYLQQGRIGEAEQLLRTIPAEVGANPHVRDVYAAADRELMRLKGIAAVRALHDYYVWDCEPIKAAMLLDPHNLPAAVAEDPGLRELRRATQTKLRHVESWEEYRAAYGAIPADPFTPDEALGRARQLGRAKAAVEAARELPPAARILSVGCWDGAIERLVMEAAPAGAQLWVTDCSTEGSKGACYLQELFPQRVHWHPTEHNALDWPEGSFDLVLCFEVLEHLPDEAAALLRLRDAVRDGGRLLLSAPDARYWVEEYLTDPRRGPPFYGHVRGFTPRRLIDRLRWARLDGDVLATEGGAVFLAKLSPQPIRIGRPVDLLAPAPDPRHDRDVAILARAPKGFDAWSLSEGHLGGSEEAVVHLAAALAREGRNVTVYAPTPTRETLIHRLNGVTWRGLESFDAASDEHSAVLFWRDPAALLQPAVQAAKYRKVLWLHDAHYQAPVAAYQSADAVVVLSRAHSGSIEAEDGYTGPFVYAQNGIDLAGFPELTEEDERQRDPHAVVYGSSPDRGLDRLLELWPDVRAAVPDATLHVYYGWEFFDLRCRHDPAFRAARGPWADGVKARIRELADQGVVYHGGVDHETLHQAYRRAGVWAYPTGFYEISCITAMKAMAAGCQPVTTAFGALPETLGAPDVHTPEHDECPYGPALVPVGPDGEWTEEVRTRFLEALVRSLQFALHPARRRDMSDWARHRYDWNVTAQLFLRAIRGAPRDSDESLWPADLVSGPGAA